MAYSWQEQILPAGAQTVPVEINYLDRSYIYLYVNREEVFDFTWDSDTRIRFDKPLDAESTVLIVRRTAKEFLYIMFSEGAAFIKENLDTQNTQFLHLAQELVEGRSIEGFFGTINMNGFRIINLAAGEEATDAVNKAQLDEVDVKVGNLESTFINQTNSYPWFTTLNQNTSTITPPFTFTKASLYLNGVCQTPGYSYSVSNNVITLADEVPAGTHVFVRLGEDVLPDTGYATAAQLGNAVSDLTSQINSNADAAAAALSETASTLSSRVNGRNSTDGQIFYGLYDLENAYNSLGATLEGNSTINVNFTSAQTDTASRLAYALQQVPSGYMFERLATFTETAATVVVRQVRARRTVGKPAIAYSLNEYMGDSYHTIRITGDYINKMRMSYVDGTLRTPAQTISYLNLQYVRALINASPTGAPQAFPTTINNGKLIPGNEANTYFLSSCFFTADGKLEVVPHKDTNVADVVRNYYYNHDAVQAMHFRYVLVKDGAVYDLVANGYTTATGWDGQPSGRTSIGQTADGTLVLAVIDGNTTQGTGVTIKRMSEYMLSQGCVNAMNLDGSGSSTMYYANSRVNSPSDGSERAMVNVIYFL